MLNIARGSFKELLEDYKDYLRVHGAQQWERDSKEVEAMRRIGAEHNDTEYYAQLAKTRAGDTIANIAIVLLHQEETLLLGYIRYVEQRFMREGGIKEKMYNMRKKILNRD